MTYSQEQYDALLAVCRSYRQDTERLEAENKQLKTECTLLDDELRNARQETINVLNKLKEKYRFIGAIRSVVM